MLKRKTPTPNGVGEVVGSEEGLKRALSAVRLVQNYAAVGAEILILIAFAMSSLDVSVGGSLAEISGLAWIWGAVFALGIDTCFILSWVRVRQLAMVVGKRRHLWWAIPLAVGMSIIVFQPVAIQQLQQSLHISFEQALANLGVNLGFLVYARSGVAVFLGAVLALTNVESSDHPTRVSDPPNDQVGGQVIEVSEQRDQVIAQNSHSDQLLLPSGDQSGDRREVIRSYMKHLSDQGEQVTANVIAIATNIPASTVRRYIRDIKKEEEFAS